MLVRTLTAGDAASYVALRREMLADAPWAFASSSEDDRFREAGAIETFLCGDRQAIVGAFEAESDPPGRRGTLLGVAGLMGNQRPKMRHRASLWGMYVTPGARGRGVGGAVLGEALRVAAMWEGVTSIGLSASIRSVAAIRLYQRFGFQAWGVEPGALLVGGEAVDEIHMVAWLGARVSSGRAGPTVPRGRLLG